MGCEHSHPARLYLRRIKAFRKSVSVYSCLHQVHGPFTGRRNAVRPSDRRGAMQATGMDFAAATRLSSRSSVISIDHRTVMTSARSLLLHLSGLAVTGLAVFSAAAAPPPLGPLPDRVVFASADGQTTLVGYVFKPEGPHSARSPAVVMMHGRAGPYSSLANGKYDASTLSQRHQKWGHLWAQQGYLAIL